ncbi:MAG: hypothetical protein V4612_01965 [Pseudomonadota bacterium]
MTTNKIFYFKNKLFDFHINIFFIEIRLYFNGLLSFLLSLLKPDNYISLFKIYQNNKRENILIIELNNFHSEIFPSWLFYLKKLSYENKIFFLAPGYVHKSRPFDVIEQAENNGYAFYKMDPRIILLCFNLGFFSRYKKVIFNTDIFYFSPLDDYSQLLNIFKSKNALKNTIFLSHGILQSMGCRNSAVNLKSQLITISPTISAEANIKYVVPLFNEDLFNQDAEKAKIFNQKKTFVSCGNIKIRSKDSNGLINALDETKKYDKNVNIIGKAPKSLMKNQNIKHYGKKLSYVELKSNLQNSHFILFLLQDNISYQYKFNSSSGSLPLALNFNLVPIIEESFAKFYCLDKTNAILYKEGELGVAIKYACNMKYNEYAKMQSLLINLKLNLIKESLGNIKTIL